MPFLIIPAKKSLTISDKFPNNNINSGLISIGNDGFRNYVSYLYFDISSIPINVSITYAELVLFKVDKFYNDYSKVFEIYPLNEYFSTYTTFRNYPKISPLQKKDFYSIQAKAAITIPITSFVRLWLKDYHVTTSILLCGKNKNSLVHFGSAICRNNYLIPFLKVNIEPRCYSKSIIKQQDTSKILVPNISDVEKDHVTGSFSKPKVKTANTTDSIKNIHTNNKVTSDEDPTKTKEIINNENRKENNIGLDNQITALAAVLERLINTISGNNLISKEHDEMSILPNVNSMDKSELLSNPLNELINDFSKLLSGISLNNFGNIPSSLIDQILSSLTELTSTKSTYDESPMTLLSSLFKPLLRMPNNSPLRSSTEDVLSPQNKTTSNTEKSDTDNLMTSSKPDNTSNNLMSASKINEDHNAINSNSGITANSLDSDPCKCIFDKLFCSIIDILCNCCNKNPALWRIRVTGTVAPKSKYISVISIEVFRYCKNHIDNYYVADEYDNSNCNTPLKVDKIYNIAVVPPKNIFDKEKITLYGSYEE